MSSSSFWSNIRWRLGGSDTVMNRLNDLIQKQIDANSDAQDVTVEEILNPIVTIPSKVVIRDNLFQSKLRTISQGLTSFFPIDPDLDSMRLWLWNEHGGRYLTDHSFMQNTVQLNGTDQTKLIFGNDDEGIAGDPIVNRLIDDQYIRVEDNPNVQIKNIAATAEGISIFLRLYIEYARSELKFGKSNCLFSKIDTEQVDYAYAAYLTDDGAISFFVRNAGREYFTTAPSASIVWTNINLPDYSATDYTTADYYTIASIPPIPDPAPYVDLCFTFNFTTKRIQIIRSENIAGPAIIISDSSTDQPASADLRGWWRLTEAGGIGDPPINTIYDLSLNALDCMAINPTWDANGNLNFSNNNAYVAITTNVSGKQINNLTTSFTFSAWARIDDIQGGYAGLVSNINGKSDGNKILIRNVGASTEVLWRGHNGSNPVDTLGVKTGANLVGDALWHHYAVAYDGIEVRIYLDGVLLFSEPQTYTLATGTASMTLGWGSTNTTLYHVTGSIQDAKLWKVYLPEAEMVQVYGQGRPLSYFPKWREDPPDVPPPPSPSTIPFENVYNVALPAVAERDMVRLHAITATGLTKHYDVGQGTQESGQPVTEDGQWYNNDPAYNPGGTGEQLLPDYDLTWSAVNSYVKLDALTFGGIRFRSGHGVIGKQLKKISVWMADINPTDAPATGNVTAKLVNNAGTLRLSASNSISATSLLDNLAGADDSNWSAATFNFPATPVVNVAADDKIQFEYDKGGGGGGTPATQPQIRYSCPPASDDVTATIDIDPNTGAATWQAREIIKTTAAPFYGKVIGEISVYLARNSTTNPAGCFLAVGIMLAGNTQVIEFARFSPNTLTVATDISQLQKKTFTLPNNTHVMEVGDSFYISMGSDPPPANGNWVGSTRIWYRGTSGATDKVAGCNIQEHSNAGDFDYPPNDIVGELKDLGSAGTPAPPQKQVGLARVARNDVPLANQYDGAYADGIIFDRETSHDVHARVYVVGPSGLASHLYHKMHVATGGFKYLGTLINSNQAALFGKKITRATFRIYKVGSPTGTLYCKIRKGDATTIILGLNGAAGVGLNVANLDIDSGPADLYSFSNVDNGQDTGYALAVGDRIMLELVGAAGTSDATTKYIQVARTHTVSAVPNVHLQTSTDNSTWTSQNNSTDDVIGVVYVGGHVTPVKDPYHTLGYVNTRVSQKVTSTQDDPGNVWNKRITQVTPWLMRFGFPTGQITCCIRDSAGALKASINTMEASNVSNTQFTQYPFPNFNQTYVLATNDRISIEYSGGNASNYIMINTNLLNTYPFGLLETYSGTTYTTKTTHDLAGQIFSGGGSTDPLARTRVAERVATTASAIKGKKISRVRVWLRKQSDPKGNVVIRVRNSASTPVALIGNIDAETQITSVATEITVTSSPISVYGLLVGDYVSVEYNGGDESNFVEVMTTKTTDAFDGVINTYVAKYDDFSWVNNTAIDLVGRMDAGGDTFTPSQEDVIIPPPVYTKDLCILAGGPPWEYIDHQKASVTHAVSQLFTNAVMPDFRFYRKVLTLEELTNIFTNRIDRAPIVFGEVAKVGFFTISEE